MSEHLKKARHWMREADIRSTGHPSTDEMAEAIWRLIRHLESVAPEVQPQMDLENQFATIWAELDRKQPRTAEVQPHRHESPPHFRLSSLPIPEPREESETSSAPTLGHAPKLYTSSSGSREEMQVLLTQVVELAASSNISLAEVLAMLAQVRRSLTRNGQLVGAVPSSVIGTTGGEAGQ
jgi:hypothetical protein